ncbi:MAG: hypothetical protein ACJ789_17975 [Thermomicrobiales bacterium]
MNAASPRSNFPDRYDLRRLVQVALEPRLADYLRSRRWYGEKSGDIVNVTWEGVGDQAIAGTSLIVGFAAVALAGRSHVWYSLPVAIDDRNQSIEPIADVDIGDVRLHIFDAIEHDRFQHWLLQGLLEPEAFRETRLNMRWTPTTAFGAVSHLSADSVARVSRAEQSNSSIIFGDQVIVKFFRKMRSGMNPDVEIGRFLTEEAHFADTPATLGEFRVDLPSGEDVSFGVAQQFVASIADGWEYALNTLRGLEINASDYAEHVNSWLEEARSLGEITAELHIELSGATANSDFAPEPIETADTDAWSSDLETALRDVRDRIKRAPMGETENATLVRAFESATSTLASRADGFTLLEGCSKIRIHGDYHLGQTLRTIDDRWVMLDFEGEPARTIEERRAKSSALKDVAGMLRSFSYAHGMTERSTERQNSALLARWEKETRKAFLAGYLSRARPGVARFLPKTDEDVREALIAWELHKALYEILYELDNRPDWVWLPLAASLKLA